jgi:hypothetical protein
MDGWKGIIFSKETAILVFLFTIVLMDITESALTVKNTWLPALIFIIPAVVWYFYFVKPTIKK